MDNFITLNGVNYIKEDIHKKQLETMKRMYEQKDFGLKPIKEIRLGGIFTDSHGKKFMKVDIEPIETKLNVRLSDIVCSAVSFKTHRVVTFTQDHLVKPIEGN